MILTRYLAWAQERFDTEDILLIESAARADSHYNIERFWSNQSYILQGFTIASTQVGATGSISVDLTNATLINTPQNSLNDVSWFTVPDNALPPTLETIYIEPASALNTVLKNGRNYVESQIVALQGTNLERAFWDPSANSGAGAEYNAPVNTVMELSATFIINQSAFSGSGDLTKIPVAIVDVVGGIVTGIQDARSLFFRLGAPSNINNKFNWNRTEATTSILLGALNANLFVPGDIISIGYNGYSPIGYATVTSVGSIISGQVTIQVYDFSGVGIPPLVGGIVSVAANSNLQGGSGSGATGQIINYYQNFNGADKDITNIKSMFDAIMTEFITVKGTQFWWQVGGAQSLPRLLDYINTTTTPISVGSYYKWSGSALSIGDGKTSGQAGSDVIAAIRTMGYGGNVYLCRMDGTGGTTTIPIANGSVLWVQLPTTGTSRSFAATGNSATNYRITPIAQFIPTDSAFVIAYREGNTLVFPGRDALEPGEKIDVDDTVPTALLAFVGATDDRSTNPP